MDGSRAERATSYAVTEGLRSAAPWGVASTSAVWLGHKFHAGFARSLGVSGKCALAITPPLFVFALAGEHAVHRLHRDGAAAVEETAARPARGAGFTGHLRCANFLMDHTLACFAMVVAPMSVFRRLFAAAFRARR